MEVRRSKTGLHIAQQASVGDPLENPHQTALRARHSIMVTTHERRYRRARTCATFCDQAHKRHEGSNVRGAARETWMDDTRG